MFISKYNKDDYNLYVERYISISTVESRYLRYKDLTNNEYGLPDGRWFVKNSPNPSIKNFSDFVESCGFMPYNKVSKDKITKALYEMQLRLDRPLMYDDFRNPNTNEVGIQQIKRHWGTMNKMKEELGLKIVQRDMTCKSKSLEDSKLDIYEACNNIHQSTGRKTISINDFNTYKNEEALTYATYYNYFKDSSEISLRDYIENIGFKIIEPGFGLVYEFEDGEVTMSQYEYQFSQYLRGKNLKYNKDYFRDVEYSDFIPNYNGAKNCDYKILGSDGKTTYVEVAGFLCKYNRNKTPNSKKRYAEGINSKVSMFKDNNLSYHILYPKPYPLENELEIHIGEVENQYRQYS